MTSATNQVGEAGNMGTFPRAVDAFSGYKFSVDHGLSLVLRYGTIVRGQVGRKFMSTVTFGDEI